MADVPEWLLLLRDRQEAPGRHQEDYFVFAASLDIVIARSDSDEAIHFPARGEMDCFASLAMTMG